MRGRTPPRDYYDARDLVAIVWGEAALRQYRTSTNVNVIEGCCAC